VQCYLIISLTHFRCWLGSNETTNKANFLIYNSNSLDFNSICSFLSFYSLVNQTMTDISPGLARRIFHEALAVWSKSSNLNFREVNDPNADIQIMFAKWVILSEFICTYFNTNQFVLKKCTCNLYLEFLKLNDWKIKWRSSWFDREMRFKIPPTSKNILNSFKYF
jgi:hypothetical protein